MFGRIYSADAGYSAGSQDPPVQRASPEECGGRASKCTGDRELWAVTRHPATKEHPAAKGTHGRWFVRRESRQAFPVGRFPLSGEGRKKRTCAVDCGRYAGPMSTPRNRTTRKPQSRPASPACLLRGQEGSLTCRHATYGARRTLAGSGRDSSDGAARVSFLSRPHWGAFRSVLAGLRKHCPAAMPVIVRTSRLRDDTLGRCARRKSRFVIMLNSALIEHEAVDTLLHEWAHALSWHLVLDRLAKDPALDPEVFQKASHDELWGCAYSRVWRAYIGDILPFLASLG